MPLAVRPYYPSRQFRGIAPMMFATRSVQSEGVRDQRIAKLVPLVTPQELYDELPLDEARTEVVLTGRSGTQAVLDGADDRLLVVIGPCSVHDPEATREYASRLATEARRHDKDLLVAMRVYFEKPRTTIGWKGLINDPFLDGSGDVNAGLRIARKLLLEVLGYGLPIGCEFLDPITPQYISDLVSWGAIGARTTESQIHRQLGSGLSMPVGFKNRTDGNVQVAVDAVRAASVSHVFPGIDADGRSAILHTRGNADCHVILRGGKAGPNYDADAVASTLELLAKSNLPQRVMIDFSHDNSGKDPLRQPAIAENVAAQLAAGNQAIHGVMVESFLVEGRQDQSAHMTYGQSITDGCLGWDASADLLGTLAAGVRARRGATVAG
jgi:3-deoxy-7-phosphoheptulonate synthase